MKQPLAVSILFAGAACPAGFASSFSVSGPGYALLDNNGSGSWQTSLPIGTGGASSAVVGSPVTSVTSVVLTNITHTWIGDLQIVLKDPAGTGYNRMARPGFTGTGFGNSGDFLAPGQTITFTPAASGNPPVPATGSAFTGSYRQTLGSGAGAWTNGNLSIFNTDLASITGPAGAWTVQVYSWAAGDIGTLGSWTLNGTDSSAGVAFCVPGQGGVGACPCGNAPTTPGAGCGNTGSGGALLDDAGTASLALDAIDPGSLTLTATSMFSGSACLHLQGDLLVPAGATFGAGIRCTGGVLKRLYLKTISGGASTVPQAGDRSISNRSADLGDPIAAGLTRYYQTYYRDPSLPNPGGSCPPIATFDITGGRIVTWGP